AHHGRDERLRALRDPRQQVAHEVGAAALPGGARQAGGDRVDEARVRVARDELDAGEAAGDEAPQEGEPGGALLAGDHVEAERLAEAVPVHGDRVHDTRIHGPTALAALDLERVQDEVRVGSTV